MDLSVIVPVFNEQASIVRLHRALINSLQALDRAFEIIYVDDGSTDRTRDVLLSLKGAKIVRLKRNFGQTAALGAGFSQAKGRIIVTIDADLQNDPRDIAALLKKLDQGYDAVSGWRIHRADPWHKRLASKAANALRRAVTGERIHDSGCTLKAYKRECLEDFEFYGEMHRYIPAMLHWRGYRVGEVKVRHYARRQGSTKYNMWRLVKGMLDLLVVIFWQKYSARPIHIFGSMGIILLLAGSLLGLYLGAMKLFFGISLLNRTTPLLAVLLLVLGVQFVVSGILADIAIRNYYASSRKKTFLIERVIEQ